MKLTLELDGYTSMTYNTSRRHLSAIEAWVAFKEVLWSEFGSKIRFFGKNHWVLSNQIGSFVIYDENNLEHLHRVTLESEAGEFWFEINEVK